MSNLTVQALLDNAVHFGHRTQKWNPKMKPYIYTKKSGIHVFDLEKTQKLLEKTLEYLRRVASEGKTILFVSTKPQTIDLIPELAKATNNPYISYRWINGAITNFSTVRKRISYLQELKNEAAQNGFEKHTKREVVRLRKKMAQLEQSLGGIESMNKLPQVLFVVDCVRDVNAVLEAKKKNIPVVGFADSNSDPSLLTCFFPANDDAMKSLTFILGLVKEAVLEGQKNPMKK